MPSVTELKSAEPRLLNIMPFVWAHLLYTGSPVTTDGAISCAHSDLSLRLPGGLVRSESVAGLWPIGNAYLGAMDISEGSGQKITQGWVNEISK